MEVHEPGFTAREVIAPGNGLYDPMTSWAEADGSMVFGDIGGQREPGWDPHAGYGSILRLRPDDTLEAILPTGRNGLGMVMHPRRAPASFTGYEGWILYVGQGIPGHLGAHRPHVVYALGPDMPVPEPFAVLPKAGRIGDGIPGAVIIGGFAPDHSPYAGSYFCQSLMNCTVYRIFPDGAVIPFMVLDEPVWSTRIMPHWMFWAGPGWGALEGEMIVSGTEGLAFTDPAPENHDAGFWRIIDDKTIEPIEVPSRTAGFARAEVAPPSFGPFAGQLFWADMGTTNLNHSRRVTEPLPFHSSILRLDETGTPQVFASQLQDGYTQTIFAGGRMLVSSLRRSYSTGEYHEPDGSIYEIRWTE